MYRSFVYFDSQRRLKTLGQFTTQKKVVLHALLVLAVLVDLPMYVSFVVIQDYNYLTYSFHKFQPMFLLAAYSITINDWSSVLRFFQLSSIHYLICAVDARYALITLTLTHSLTHSLTHFRRNMITYV